jgi:hypothetical protein
MQSVKSQIVKEKQFVFTVGNQGAYCDSFPDGANLDFLNYVYRDKFTGNLAYISFVGYFKFSDTLDLSLTLGMYSDLAPTKNSISFRYFPFKMLGFGIGFMGYPQYINEYNLYHWNADEGLYADLDPNYRQHKMFNYGFALGPDLRYSNSRLSVDFRAYVGLRWVDILDVEIYQKAVNGNYRRVVHYRTTPSPNLYLYPEINLGVRLFTISKTDIGIRIRSAAELSKRAINYTRTTYDWTAEDAIVSKVKPGSHSSLIYELDFGLQFQW